MNDINQIISELYVAYNAKDLEKWNILITKAKEIDENNVYLKKYIVLFDWLKNNSNQNLSNSDTKIIKIKWKTLKCKFCGWNIWLTKQNTDSINLYSKDQSQNLKLICNYCGKENIFETLQKNQFKSLYLNINIWDQVTINKKTYKVIWWVKYTWTWKTTNSWKLNYIEWIVLDESWDTYYYSESLSNWSEDWESWVEKETEISRKIIPDFGIKLNWNSVLINWKKIKIYETCKVVVESSIWDNSKNYTIWEKIITKQFDYKWKKYILEYENTQNQSEIWIYETYHKEDDLNFFFIFIYSYLIAMFYFWYTGILIAVFWVTSNIWIVTWSIIWIIFVNSKLVDWKGFPKKIKIFYSCLFIIILTSYFSFNFFYYEKDIKKTDLETLTNSSLEKSKWLYKIDFNNDQKQIVNTKTQTYLKWGTKTTTKTLEWIKFKIETQNDLETLKKIKNQEIIIETYDNQSDHFDFWVNKISDYFKNIISAYK